MEHLQYPIGKFISPSPITEQMRNAAIATIEQMPDTLKKTVETFTEKHWNTTYRSGGWNAQQLVHHIAESHINSFIRYKLALTEDNPTIKPYLEDKWVKLKDVMIAPPSLSIELLNALHQRWVILLRTMSHDDFQRTFIHPEKMKTMTLDTVTQLYAWHCKHHLAHLNIIKESL
jgi:hypothetical protein